MTCSRSGFSSSALARLLWAAVVTVVLCAAVADSVRAARHHQRRCVARDAKVVAQDREVQVFRVRSTSNAESAPGSSTRACLRSTGRSVKLGETFNGLESSSAIDRLRLVGHVVGSIQHTTDLSCKADCPPGYQHTRVSVQVNDVRRRLQRAASVTGGLLTGRRALVSRSGITAWLEGSAGSARLKTLGPGGVRLVDQGNIDPSTVRISGRTLSWRKDRQTRTQKLR